MADLEGRYHQVPLDGHASQSVASGRWFKVGITLISGTCLVLLSVATTSVFTSTLDSTSAAESTSLFGLTSLKNGFGISQFPRTFPGLLPISRPQVPQTHQVASGSTTDCQPFAPSLWSFNRGLHDQHSTVTSATGREPVIRSDVADPAKFVSDAMEKKGIVVFSKSY